jgi:hypothetical protein
MQHITGIPRNQMVFSSLEDTISPNNPVRFVDALWCFVIVALGFKIQTLKQKVVQVSIPKYFLKYICMDI